MSTTSDVHSGVAVSSSSSSSSIPAPKNWVLWAGRVLSALPILVMLLSAAMKLSRAPEVIKGWVDVSGWQEGMLIPIAVIEIASALLFAIPRTAVLGAIVVSSYLTAAFATHLRVGDAGGGMMPLLLAVFAWVGIYLREPRLHAVLPLRR